MKPFQKTLVKRPKRSASGILTPMQLEIAKLRATGMSKEDIAKQSNGRWNTKTVDRYCAIIHTKLGVHKWKQIAGALDAYYHWNSLTCQEKLDKSYLDAYLS